MIATPHEALAGKHAFVTGGGRGIGAAIARGLLLAGASVTIAGRNRAVLDATVVDLSALGEIGSVEIDVGQREAVAQAFAAARERFGPVSILVNNAGQAESAPFLKTGEDMWNRMLTVNLTGTYHCTGEALPDMLAARWGRVVNVASTAGLTGYGYVAAYCAAKHGVVGLTRSLALEVATKGVTVNAVCPGYTETDIVRDAVANIVAKTGRSEQEALRQLAQTNPQGRLVQPGEVANAVLWLCMPGSGSMNGQSIAVDGGEVM